MDVTDLDSIRAAVTTLTAPVDAVVMNAGGSGGPSAMALTRDGATHIFAANVLGHVVLLEELIKASKLTDVALYVGSEAARGIPKFRMARPAFATSSADEFASVIDGSYFQGTKPDTTLAYGQAKYLGALWMSALARLHPDLRFITMSPGSTSGTEGPNSLPLPMRLAAKYVMPVIGPRLGIAHPLETGALRLVDGINRPQSAQRRLLRQRRQHHYRPRQRPSRHLPRPRQPHLPRQRRPGHPPVHPRQWVGLVTTLADALALARSEQGLGVVSTLRPDASIQSSLVNAGMVAHPATGNQVLAFVTAGAVKLANLRARPVVTTTFRSGWQWATIEGHAELAGPDDPQPWLDLNGCAYCCARSSSGPAAPMTTGTSTTASWRPNDGPPYSSHRGASTATDHPTRR